MGKVAIEFYFFAVERMRNNKQLVLTGNVVNLNAILQSRDWIKDPTSSRHIAIELTSI